MHWPQPPDLSMTLGRLLERSEQTLTHIGRIERRLEAGDQKFTGLETQMRDLEAKLAAKRAEAQMPNIERAIKAAVPYLLFIIVFLVTGKADVALQALQAVGGK